MEVIAVDVDEVLAEFLPACNRWYNRRHGTSFELSDYASYSFAETWGGTQDEAIAEVYAFFRSPDFADLAPLPGAVEAIHRLKKHFRLAVVTSRQLFVADATRQWLARHFGADTFEHVLFGNIWLPREDEARAPIKRSKREMCQSIGAVCLIDDQPHYVQDVADVVQLPILFNLHNLYRWGRGYHFLTATDWPEVIALIEAKFLKNDSQQ